MRKHLREVTGAILLGILGWVAVSAGEASGQTAPRGPEPSTNPPQDIPLPVSRDEADEFAWKLFVAMNWPEMPEFCGEHRNNTREATSPSAGNRPKPVADDSVPIWAAARFFRVMGVSSAPGNTALIRWPSPARSAAADSTSPLRAAFVMQ